MTRKVGAGQSWRIATAKALEASSIFVLLFSENAAPQSSDIAKELAAATLCRRRSDHPPCGCRTSRPRERFSTSWLRATGSTPMRTPMPSLANWPKASPIWSGPGARDESVLPFDRADGGRPLSAGKRTTKPVLITAIAVTVIAAAAGLFWLYPRPAAAPVPVAAARIAVLPFDTLSDRSQARHFADALTDEIVTRLNSNRIQVVSREDAATLRGNRPQPQGRRIGRGSAARWHGRGQ